MTPSPGAGDAGCRRLLPESHRKIFQAMMKLSELREPVDLITLTDTLRKQGELEEAGGAAYLATW
jgi:replicative DNA helicase